MWFFSLAYLGLFLACAIIVVATAKTWLGLVVDEFGQPLGSDEKTLILIIAIVGLSWMASLELLTFQWFVRKKTFSISEEGCTN